MSYKFKKGDGVLGADVTKEEITKEVIQAFHDLLYREKYILKKKVKR